MEALIWEGILNKAFYGTFRVEHMIKGWAKIRDDRTKSVVCRQDVAPAPVVAAKVKAEGTNAIALNRGKKQSKWEDSPSFSPWRLAITFYHFDFTECLSSGAQYMQIVSGSVRYLVALVVGRLSCVFCPSDISIWYWIIRITSSLLHGIDIFLCWLKRRK